MEKTVAGWYRQSVMAAPGGGAPAKVFLSGEGSRSLDLAALSAALETPTAYAALGDGHLSAQVAERADDLALYGLPAVDAAAEAAAGANEFDLYAVATGRRGLFESLFAPAAAALAVVAVIFGLLGWRSLEAARDYRGARGGGKGRADGGSGSRSSPMRPPPVAMLPTRSGSR